MQLMEGKSLANRVTTELLFLSAITPAVKFM